MKKILLVGDMVSYGKIALSVQIPILSAMGHSVHSLTTAMVSNNFDYQTVRLESLTDYMEDTINIWKELNFTFDIVFVGFMNERKQFELIKELIAYHEKKPFVIMDPIMGDDGELYHSLTEDMIDVMKEASSIADLVIPNLTEAMFLVDGKKPETFTEDHAIKWIRELSDGKRDVVITSVNIADKHYVYSLKKDGSCFKQEFEYVNERFAGTGDIFTALMIGSISNGLSLEKAVEENTSYLSEILKQELKVERNEKRDVVIERYLANIASREIIHR